MKVTGLIVATALALPLPAAAQDANGWHKVDDPDGIDVEVEIASIKAVDGGRSFRVMVKHDGGEDDTLFTLKADCAGHAYEFISGRRMKDGVDKGDFSPPPEAPRVTPVEGVSQEAAFQYVCKAPLAGQ